MFKKKPRHKRYSKVAKADKSLSFSYKRVNELQRYVNDQGSITPRSRTGLSQKQQRQLATEVKRARHLCLLPFTQTV